MKAMTIMMIFSSIFLNVQLVQAEENLESRVFSELKKMDDLIFEENFNLCRTEVLPPIIADDFEFYHDKGGIQNREQFFNAIKENICSGIGDKLIRKLVPGTLKVFPLTDKGELYGAIQSGEHKFYFRRANNQLEVDGIAKFTHLWILQDKLWKLTRVLSYDHQPAKD